jgi:hypothetical protein
VYANGVNIALQKPVSWYGPTTDGNVLELQSTWLNPGPSSLVVDLQLLQSVTTVIIVRFTDRRFTTSSVIQTSADGVVWTNLFNSDYTNGFGQGAGTDIQYVETGSGQAFSLNPPQLIRYIRCWQNGTNIDLSNRITEVLAYADFTGPYRYKRRRV